MPTDSKRTALKQTQWRQAAGSQDIDRMCIAMQNIYAQYWKIQSISHAGLDPIDTVK